MRVCVCVCVIVLVCGKKSRAQKSGRIYTAESVIFKHDYKKKKKKLSLMWYLMKEVREVSKLMFVGRVFQAPAAASAKPGGQG